MKNPSLDVQELLKGVQYFIHANSFEELSLWSYWHNRCGWIQAKMGMSQVIGHIGDDLPQAKEDPTDVRFPVNVSFTTSTINGNKICFYDVISRYADYQMVDNWIKIYFGGPITDAQNFHLCMNHVKTLV